MNAAEQALRQLQVSDVERNAILEAFRYKEGKMAAAVNAANARADAVVDEAAAKVVEIGVTPFTRCVKAMISSEGKKGYLFALLCKSRLK